MLGVPGNRQGTEDDLWALIHLDDREYMHRSIERSAADMSDLSVDFRLRTVKGDRWMRTYSRPRRLESGAIVWDGIGLDVTAERAAEDRLSYLAYHDPLTGMPNRSLFDTSLAKALNAHQTNNRQVALMLIDLDGFQEVNDAVGRQIGDSVLRGVSKRVVDFASRRAGYSARTGGDEFAVFYSSDTQGDLPDDADALCRDLMQPLHIDDRPFTIEASIGVATFPFHSTAEDSTGEPSVSELMKRSNIALHEAKRAGRGMHQVYSLAADDRRRNQTLVRQSLREAIDGRQFRLHYHPLVNLASGEIVGAEALIRWSHPTLGMQRPDIFIPLAEKTGLIIPIGAWVIEEAMRQAVEWAQRHANVPKIAINVSGAQLLHPGFIETIEGALARTGAKASQLEIELTEGFMIEASPVVLNVLNTLKRMGFALAVDDFGTGYASFRHLRDLPVDKLKIDQTFVRQMVVDSSDASIIRAIITLAKSLELEVVAEGIEDLVQRNFLRDEGCKIGQGYLFSLPLTAEDFVYLLDLGVTLPMGAPPEPSAVAERKADPK
jgi:diguanylate cyclase (GGDEF)-like protein